MQRHAECQPGRQSTEFLGSGFRVQGQGLESGSAEVAWSEQGTAGTGVSFG